jgi:hypothetical protein
MVVFLNRDLSATTGRLLAVGAKSRKKTTATLLVALQNPLGNVGVQA